MIGGIVLAFARHLPHPHVEPDFILLLVVPPLLYSAAWSTDWLELRRDRAPDYAARRRIRDLDDARRSPSSCTRVSRRSLAARLHTRRDRLAARRRRCRSHLRAAGDTAASRRDHKRRVPDERRDRAGALSLCAGCSGHRALLAGARESRVRRRCGRRGARRVLGSAVLMEAILRYIARRGYTIR